MKSILLFTTFLLSACALFAQAPANVDEDTIQIGNAWDVGSFRPANINAHSHGNLDINGVSSDLYVFTWDYGHPLLAVNRGFVVRQYNAGTPVESGTSPQYEAIRYQTNSHLPSFTYSLEVGILRHDDSTFIALTYCSDIYNSTSNSYTRKYFLDIYYWNPLATGGPLIPIDDYHYELGITDDNSRYWIHQDVNNQNKIVIAWEQEDKIFTCAGEITSSGFQLSGAGDISAPGGLRKPDVAMMTESNGTTDLYYVATANDNTKLTVFAGDFNSLYNTPSSFSVTPNYSTAASGTYGLPRIDAPDNAQYSGQENVWSCVVADHTGTNDYIFAATASNQTGIKQQILNNNSGLGNLNDISATTNPNTIYNRRPTVAFSNENLNVFYAWIFRNSSWYLPVNPLINSVSYLSVKTTLNFNLINNPASQYFIIPKNNYGYDNIVPAVGLSTQNDASPQLFTAFSMGTAEHYVPYFGLKTVDWNTVTGYKPGGNTTGITATLNADKTTVSPNPFHNGFQINLQEPSRQAYTLSLFNILGQKVYETKGDIEILNRGIKNVGNNLNTGTYFLQLKSENDKVFRKEIVKW